MAWRFAPSKFKNTTPKIPKKEETIFDLPIGTLSCTNNGIQASASHIAFCIEGEGGKLGVVPVGTKGRRLRKDITVVCAHTEQVDDFAFLTFDDELLVTCSRDEKVKLWRVGSEGVHPTLEGEVDLGSGVLLGSLAPHSTASSITAHTGIESAVVIDWEKQESAYELHGLVDRGLSCTWSEDGRLLAASSDKGRLGHIWDIRAGSDPIHTINLHTGMGREARILFAGNRLVSSGFTNKRVQEVQVFEMGKYDAPVHKEEFTATTGLLIPLYDPDTKLIFLAGKGTNKLVMAELQDRSPVMSRVYELSLPEQLLGACLGSKRTLKVMEGEVQTLYELTKNSVVPYPCIVPRRTYRDFHADLFPDTRGSSAGCTAEQWRQGSDEQPDTISLAPAGTQKTSALSMVAPAVARPEAIVKPTTNASNTTQAARPLSEVRPTVSVPMHETREHSPGSEKENIDVSAVPPTSKKGNTEKPPTVRLRQPATDFAVAEKRPMSTAGRIRPKSCVVGQIASKFRHVEVLAGIKANNSVFSNLRNVNTRLHPETNGVCASNSFVAIPLAGTAGIVCILSVDEPHKLEDGVMDGIYNKAQVSDLQWNPFDEQELACGTDVGIINFWKLSKGNGPRNEMEPHRVLKVSGEKIVCLRWHPLATDLMAVALSDASVELWNVKEGKRYLQIPAHEQGVLSISWSADGRRLATVGKDLMLRVFAPQLGASCLLLEAQCLESPRSARVLFACDDRMIIIVGFTKSSTRQVQLYDAMSLRPIHTQHMDNAMQPLVPHYDFDTSVLFLTGKGDRTVQMFEVCFDSPYLLPLSPFTCSAGHQAVAFHNKSTCNVMAVEFQRGWRLTEKTLELLIFRVPRIKKDVFQSDLFPEALVTWEPVCDADEWVTGCENTPRFRSLCPAGVSASASDSGAPARLARLSQFTSPSKSSSASVVEHDDKQVESPTVEEETEPVQEPSTPAIESKPAVSVIDLPIVSDNEIAPEMSDKSSTVVCKDSSAGTPTPICREDIQELDYDALENKAHVALKAPLATMDDDDVKKEVEASWSNKIGVDTTLEQDAMEGVAEEEWMDE